MLLLSQCKAPKDGYVENAKCLGAIEAPEMIDVQISKPSSVFHPV
jgi:hypothetical protein